MIESVWDDTSAKLIDFSTNSGELKNLQRRIDILNSKQKLTEDTLFLGITFLNSYYTNWKFDTTNSLKMDVWFVSLKNYLNIEFENMINIYISDKHTFAPSSPGELFKQLDDWHGMVHSFDIEEFDIPKVFNAKAKLKLYLRDWLPIQDLENYVISLER